MADATERMIFRIKVERMLSKYSKEDQKNILKEIDEIKEISNCEILEISTISLLIYLYFKLKN